MTKKRNFAKKSILLHKVALQSHWPTSNCSGLGSALSESSLWWPCSFCFWMADHDSERLARWRGMRRLPTALGFLLRGTRCTEHPAFHAGSSQTQQTFHRKLGTKALCSGNTGENTCLFLGSLLKPQEMLVGTSRNKLLTHILDHRLSNLLSAELQY